MKLDFRLLACTPLGVHLTCCCGSPLLTVEVHELKASNSLGILQAFRTRLGLLRHQAKPYGIISSLTVSLTNETGIVGLLEPYCVKQVY